MNEDRVREIIREELKDMLWRDRFFFKRLIQIQDGENVQLGKGSGTKIGTESTQKLGFYDTIPVNQPETVADPIGQTTDKDEEARTAVETIIDRLQELGLIK